MKGRKGEKKNIHTEKENLPNIMLREGNFRIITFKSQSKEKYSPTTCALSIKIKRAGVTQTHLEY